ncbi:MAG: helix-hairpin-helix domain-containing protein [Nitrospirae bacterium]|nr:helix-hairpin-helix domain-containing protein [Candidatus Manganitrophaceae bacterium]
MIDVNSADKEALMQVPGIDERRAQMIIDYRNQHGPFINVEEIHNIPGFGRDLLSAQARSMLTATTKAA